MEYGNRLWKNVHLLLKKKLCKIATFQTCRNCLQLDVRGSVHHGIIHTEIASKMQQCIKIYYSTFTWSSTCFGRHAAHHQELKTALAAFGFAYVGGCWTLKFAGRCPATSVSPISTSGYLNIQQPPMYAKPEAASAVLSSWWWAVCGPKHAELYMNME